MFCTNCGKPIEETALFCQNCGVKINDSVKAVNVEEERVIKEGACNQKKNIYHQQFGYGMLTTKRFIYVYAVKSGGYRTRGFGDFEIILSDIVEIRQGKYGLGKTIILKTKDGTEYNFGFNHQEEWEMEFQKLLKK